MHKLSKLAAHVCPQHTDQLVLLFLCAHMVVLLVHETRNLQHVQPQRLQSHLQSSPNKAASASPAASPARKASAVITRRPGIPSLDLKDIQQENQGKSASKAAQMLSPSSPGAGARQALQESPTKYVERFLMSGIDASVFCCVPGMLVMQVSKQSSSCKHTPASKGATLAGVYQKCARAACKFDCTPDCTVAIVVLLLV